MYIVVGHDEKDKPAFLTYFFDQLQNFLKERGYVIETVTIIRDRTTGT